MKMVYEQHVMGGVIASLFTFALFQSIRRKKKSIDSSVRIQRNECFKNSEKTCQSDLGRKTDIIIVGAGAALAYTLSEDGRKVHVIKRDLSQPDRIVGELLQPGGWLKLMELGLEGAADCVCDIDALCVYGDALYKDGKSTKLLYPFANFDSIVAGRSFHHGRFVQKMRDKSASLPNLENCNLSYTNHGHVVLADPSHILFYPISSTEVRCLVDIASQKVPSIFNGEMAHHLKTTVAPQIPLEMQIAFISAINEGNIRTTPNRNMPAAPYLAPGALLMGDAFKMRHTLTGGGMTVALSDVIILRNLLRALHSLNDASSLCKYFESFYTRSKPVASTIDTLAGALYKVFSASPDPRKNEMRQACFDYLSLGVVFSSGLTSILSGIKPRPLSLVLHFFAVTIYGVGRVLILFPSQKTFVDGKQIDVCIFTFIFIFLSDLPVYQFP